VLLSGVIPAANGVSWDGHLFGGAAGAVMAFRLRKRPPEGRAAA
jgi:membrane associated rhomboid family serine protease